MDPKDTKTEDTKIEDTKTEDTKTEDIKSEDMKSEEMEKVVDFSLERKKKKSTGHFLVGILVGIMSTLLIISVAYLGINIGKILNLSSTTIREDYDPFQEKLAAIASIIENYYYLEDVSEEVLENGAYYGMVNAIEDPYSTYYSAEELSSLFEQTEGVYYGIGAYVSLDTELLYPKVAGTISGAPAEEVGLRADDIIYEVDSVNTYDMDLNAVVAMIKGEEGTTVNLTILRKNEYLSIDVERRKVESPTVELQMLEDGMAYIRIVEFDAVTVDQFAEALAEARGKGMKGLMIDLRTNPGGSLGAVVDIARMLLPEGLIVYTEDKAGNRQEYTSDGKKAFDQPLVVLIDGNSASASEILAGAIQDYEIGTLVGTTTFGKGIVQQVISLSDGSGVKLTVSSYFTPKGRNIHGIGVSPDFECEFEGEAYYENGYDNQLEYAKEVLKGLMK